VVYGRIRRFRDLELQLNFDVVLYIRKYLSFNKIRWNNYFKNIWS